jgi:hypothetical protein
MPLDFPGLYQGTASAVPQRLLELAALAAVRGCEKVLHRQDQRLKPHSTGTEFGTPEGVP